MSPSPSNRLVLLTSLLLLGAACREPAAPPAARSPAPRVSPDAPGALFDLGSVIHRVHFAYRQEGNAWTAGHSTWSARVTEGGLTFTPRHALPEVSAQALTGTPVTFGAVLVSRGGVSLDGSALRGALSQEGALTLTRGPVEEQLQNREDGIEQRWSIAHRPEGQGDLLLRVPVRGLRLAGETAQGVHFADASGLGVRYGHATWTDASGRQSEIRAHAVAGAVEFRVPESLLTTAAFPVMLAPTISPEFGLDSPVTAPGGGGQTTPAIASNGTDYLVVWADDRGGDSDIYGARVSQAGAVLDILGLPIGVAINAQQSPAVAFDGTNYLVVWSDGRRGSGNDIYGARVSPAGSVLDPNGLALATSTVFTLQMRAPAIAFDGTNSLVVWEEKTGFNAPTDLNGVRVSPSGQALGSPFVVSNATGSQLAASLAFDGTNYLVVWQDDRAGQNDIYGARVSPSGTLVDTGGIIINSAQQAQTNPTVAFNGTSYFVAWEDARTSSMGIDLYGTRVAPNGSVLDGAGLTLITLAANQTQPALTRLGTQYLLAWQDLRNGSLDVYAARLDAAGAVQDASGLPVMTVPGDQSAVAVASSGTSALVTWGDARTLDIAGARVDAAGTVLDPTGVTVSLNTNSETNPAVAFDGTNYLVVWQDNRGSGFDLYGVRVSASGTILDPSGMLISGANNHQRNPAVAFDGTNYLVVWEDTRNNPGADIFGARVSPAGMVLDSSGLPFCQRFSPQEHPAVAFDGTNYLVVWDDGGTSSSRDIYGTRVSKAGAVLDATFIGISTDANDQATPALAFDGTNYLVVWTDLRNSSTADVYGARVSRAGAVLDATGVQLAGGSEAQTDPAVAFDGTNYLLVWSDYQAFPSSSLFARRVRTSGIPIESTPIAVSTAEGLQRQASVVFDGTNYLVAWQDGRSGTGLDLYAGRVSRAGTVLDEDGFILSANAADESAVALAVGSAQAALAVYQVVDESLGSNVQRLKARRLLPGSTTNTPPTAQSQSLTTDEDVALALELTGTDAEGGTLTYTVATPPAHGALTGTAPKFAYVPAKNYSGSDSFTFTVSDGQATSAPGTISITIAPVNDAPVPNSPSVTTPEETPKAITLAASDAENDPVSFMVVSGPSHGTLTGTPPALTYTPAKDYAGPDSFTFTASDGVATSAPSTASITVTPVNDAPVATSLSLSTPEDTALPITLSGTDAEGTSLTFALTSQPAHGTLTGTAPNLTYTPAPGYHGADSFTFTVSDGVATSAPGTISLFIARVNNAPPTTSGSAITTAEDTAVGITLAGFDPDGDALTFTVTAAPAHGTLTGTAPNLTYTPAANYFGPDGLTFTVSDGQYTSEAAMVSITVTSVNDAPVAETQSLTTPEETPKALTLTAVDPEGDPVSFAIASGPSHGTLTGTPPELTYTPAANYSGPDSFTFTASDGQATSPATTVSLTIGEVNDAPVALAQTLTVAAGNPTAIALDGSDGDGEELTFAIVSPPEVGTLTGKPPDVLYTAPASFRGSTHFTFSVSDGRTTSEAEVQLTVEQRSLTVSAAVDTLRPAQNQPVRFYANAVDEAGADIALQWDFGDGQTSQEEFPLHTFTVPGTYAVRLKATTATEEATTVLRMRVRRSAPTPLSMDVPSAPVIVGVEGSALPFTISEPQSGFTYTWNFGDGTSTSTGTTASHTWADDGSFTLKVTASSTTSESKAITRTVLIHNTLPVPLPEEKLSTEVGKPFSFQLSATDAAGASDPLRWELVSGEGTLTPDGAFTWTPSQGGLATLITKVIDGDGGESRLALQFSAGSIPPGDSGGCGCGTSTGDASGAFGLGMLLLGLVAMGRRSRS